MAQVILSVEEYEDLKKVKQETDQLEYSLDTTENALLLTLKYFKEKHDKDNFMEFIHSETRKIDDPETYILLRDNLYT